MLTELEKVRKAVFKAIFLAVNGKLDAPRTHLYMDEKAELLDRLFRDPEFVRILQNYVQVFGLMELMTQVNKEQTI